MRRVAILGATGSVGRQAIETVLGSSQLELCALAVRSSADEAVTTAEAHGLRLIAVEDRDAAARAGARFAGRVLEGPEGVAALAEEADADIVLNAVVGAAGLDATLRTLEAGVDLALANKESLVAGGPLVLDALDRSPSRLLPVDSEHSALFQLVAHEHAAAVESLVLTASGGPFRGRTRDDLVAVGVEQALAHPTWSMGPKISLDSATLMNKGLELIEAHVLFGLPLAAIDVVVHRQSTVHALVRLRDGALLAHLGLPDMRVPISYALHYPERPATPAARLDLTQAFSLDFAPPDLETFQCLALARAAGEAGGTAPCVLNAANEAAVEAFVAGRCGFLDIAALVATALDAVEAQPLTDRAQVDDADARARAAVREALTAAAR